MKKCLYNILIIFFAFVSAFFLAETCFSLNLKHVQASSQLFAQIKNSNTYLFKSAELKDTISNKICLLEKTYFVEILNKINEVCYKVNYGNLTGYVACDEVDLINEIPSVPYPKNIKLDVYSGGNCYLRSAPEVSQANTITVIEKGTKGITYLGKIFGEEIVDFGGNVWYLVEYANETGYLYSKYAVNLNAIIPNNEKVTLLNNNFTNTLNPLTNFNCLLIIFFTLVPAVVILYLLYKPKKALKKVKINPKENIEIIDADNFYDENL